MSKLIFHNDFIFFDNISIDDMKSVIKMQGKVSDVISIVCSVAALLFMALWRFSCNMNNDFFVTFCFIFILNISVKIWHLLYAGKIIGLAYGVVLLKQTKKTYK